MVLVLLALLLCEASGVALQFFILKELMMNDSTEVRIDDMVVPTERLPGETDQQYVDRVVAAVLQAGGNAEGED